MQLNEIAVALFIKGQISFLEIENYVEKAIKLDNYVKNPDLETILNVDKETRKLVTSWL